MIILIHGTGDDDRKSENWMPWVASFANTFGKKVLTLPGVASSQYSEVADRGLDFIKQLPQPVLSEYSTTRQHGDDVPPDLRAALGDLGNEIAQSLGTPHRREADVINELKANQRNEDGKYATGIKLRIAVAGLCALAYMRRCRGASVNEIRIIGHSRGGAAAVGLHNFLCFHNIKPKYTLTLDPCHGIKTFRNKPYYHNIWEGRLYNIPCEQEVGDRSFEYTFRPPITGHGTATVFNFAKLRQIRHGHMGKLRSLIGSESEKAISRSGLSNSINYQIFSRRTKPTTFSEAIEALFKFWIDRTAPDYPDKCIIANGATHILCKNL